METKDAMFDDNHTDAAADDDRRSKILKTQKKIVKGKNLQKEVLLAWGQTKHGKVFSEILNIIKVVQA